MLFYKTIPAAERTIIIAIALIAFLNPVSFAQDLKPVSADNKISITTGNRLHLDSADFKRAFINLVINDSFDISKGAKILKTQIAAYNGLYKKFEADLKQTIGTPISIKDVSMALLGKRNDYNTDTFNSINYNLFNVQVSATALQIPVTITYQNNYYPFLAERLDDRISFSFSRQTFLDGIKKKLAGKFRPEDFLNEIKDPVEQLKTTALHSLKRDMNDLKEKYKDLLNEKFSLLGDVTDLLFKDPGSIKQHLLNNEWIAQLQNKSELLAQLQNRINTGQPVNMQELNSLKTEFKKYQATKELVTILANHNKKWSESGLLARIKESNILKKEAIQKVINDPLIIKKLAKQKLDLNSFQRLFLSITKLNIGKITADFNRQLTDNTILSGINTGFLAGKNKSVDVIAGTQRTTNSLFDFPFTNNIYNSNNRMMGLQMNNTAAGNTSQVSLLAIQGFSNNTLPFANYAPPKRTMIIGISKQLEFNKTNLLNMSLSKSSGYLQNEIKETGSPDHRANNLFNTDDILKSIALTINYTGQFEKLNLQTETYVRYTGINYDNPATLFIPAGSKEAGLSICKLFLRKRLQFSARTNWRIYKFSETSNNQYRNSSHFVDIKWKLKKGQSISLRYQPLKSTRLLEGIKSVIGNTEKLTANLNLAKKIRSFQYRNNISMAYLKNKYTGNSGYDLENQSIMLTSLQSFIAGKNVFYSNTSFNKTNTRSAYFFFNTSFNSDLGITYNINQKLSASSSVNYNSVQAWYRQLAIRQSLNGELGKKLSMDIYIDIGKNIKLLQPLPYSLLRAEWSIQYLFNR